ncbi:hypothetical protein CBR65_04585 [Cellvibrio sp. PSBB006]|nr:hypothetical protein CBR65_04585 [Cellvibrio sp. PSBB006]
MQTIDLQYQLVNQSDTEYDLFVSYIFGGWIYRLVFKNHPSKCIRYSQTPTANKDGAIAKGNRVAASIMETGVHGSRRVFC